MYFKEQTSLIINDTSLTPNEITDKINHLIYTVEAILPPSICDESENEM